MFGGSTALLFTLGLTGAYAAPNTKAHATVGTSYTTLNTPVVRSSGDTATVILRAQNDTLLPNTGTTTLTGTIPVGLALV